MDVELIQKRFVDIGSRVKIAPALARRQFDPQIPITLDVRNDSRGEFFQVDVDPNRAVDTIDLKVVDCRPKDKHLLLMLKSGKNMVKFLAGHDERHWFVAGLPDGPLRTVYDAIEILKPSLVVDAQVLSHLKVRRLRSMRGKAFRRNKAFIRQGEWFFVPAPGLVFDGQHIFRNEPINRGMGKSHIVSELYREGGETVYVNGTYAPNGFSEDELKDFLQKPENSHVRSAHFRVMQRNALVYARGKVTHVDHATIELHGWHRVFLSRESESRASRNVAFLD